MNTLQAPPTLHPKEYSHELRGSREAGEVTRLCRLDQVVSIQELGLPHSHQTLAFELHARQLPVLVQFTTDI